MVPKITTTIAAMVLTKSLFVKLTFEMLPARGQQHSFPTHEHMLSWKYRRFWQKMSWPRGNRAPKLALACSLCVGSNIHFRTRTDVLVKVSKFLCQKCLDPRNQTPSIRIHAESSNRHFLSNVIEYKTALVPSVEWWRRWWWWWRWRRW